MFVGTTRLPIFGSIPLLLNAGLLLLLDSSGKIVQMKLDTYGFLDDSQDQEYTLDDAIDRLSKAILMKRYSVNQGEINSNVCLIFKDMTMRCFGLNN
jgi:hypothetical protein